MLRSRTERAARIAAFVLIVLGLSHGLASAQSVSGTTWLVPGEMKMKIQKAGKETFLLPLSQLHFGPQGVLAASEYMLVLNDGFDAITTTGTYALNQKGKILLMPDGSSIQSDLEDLLENVGGLAPGDVSVSCVKSKAKAKVRSKQGFETMRAAYATKCVATVISLGASVKVNLRMKKAAGIQIP